MPRGASRQDDDPGMGAWGNRPDQHGWGAPQGASRSQSDGRADRDNQAGWNGQSSWDQTDQTDWTEPGSPSSSGRGRPPGGGYGAAYGDYGSAGGQRQTPGQSQTRSQRQTPGQRQTRSQRSTQGRTAGRGRSAPYGGGAGMSFWASARARWRRHSRLARAGYVLATLAAVIAVVAGIGAFAVWEQLDASITKVHVGGLTGRTVYGAQNILVLGSQERQGQQDRRYFGTEAAPGTANSDNLLIVHLNSTHTRATVLSIPRDLFVYEPACKERHYIGRGTEPAQAYPPGAIIDGALNIGGPTCAVKTVEDLTGIKLDHFVEFDFNSFREMVNSIGGVQVCVPKGGYNDSYSHLHLTAGLHTLKWNQALAYVRTRHGVGSGTEEGTDLARIQLQQAFISSVSQKIQRKGILTDLPKLYGIAKTAAKALTVDQNLGSVSQLLGLAKSLVHLHSKDISLITIPTAADTYPGLQEHLMAVQPQDDVLYNMARTGQVWHGQLPVEPYSKVQVKVLNGTGQGGLAARTKRSLTKLGFDVVSVGNAPSYTATTTVDYAGTEQADSAYTLMTALTSFPAGDNTLSEPAWQDGHPGPVTLVLGADFGGVNKPAVVSHQTTHHSKSKSNATPAVSKSVTNGPGSVESRNAGANICSGLPPAYNPNG